MSVFSKWSLLGLAATAALATVPAHAEIVVTVEAAGVQSVLTSLAYGGQETFDTRTGTGVQSFTTDFNSGGAITGTYTNVTIRNASNVGGADLVGKFAGASVSTPYTLNLSNTGTGGVNYFGYWFSALSVGNFVYLYSKDALVYKFSPEDLIAKIGPDYYGNPNNGTNKPEAYAFVNFYDTAGTFDRIVFTTSGNGYESDNHTVGLYSEITGRTISISASGIPISAVPEPVMGLSLGVGLGAMGLMGLMARRRKPARIASRTA